MSVAAKLHQLELLGQHLGCLNVVEEVLHDDLQSSPDHGVYNNGNTCIKQMYMNGETGCSISTVCR